MSIQANMRTIGKRLPCTVDYEMGVNDSGEIQYLEEHLYDDNGFTIGSELAIVFVGPALKSCYDNLRWQTKIFNARTDTASNTYARAPGSLEGITMTEHIMERISYEVGRDPVEVRLNNFNRTMTDTMEVIQQVLRDSEYYKRREEVNSFNKAHRWKKRGLRVAFTSYPITLIEDYHVILSVYQGDGTIDVKTGVIEIGQGTNTMIAQVVAYTLNISIDKVRIKPPDAFSTPNSFTVGGTRSTQSACFGAIKCCQIILDRLAVVRESLNNPTWELLVRTAYNRGINLQASYRVTNNDHQYYRVSGAAVTEVELDILTGEHEVLRVDIVEDVGTGINPKLDVGQVEGAFIMGLGYWTHEEIIYDDKTGEILTDRTWYYHVPIAKDIPIDFRVSLLRNSYNPLGVLGSKGVSEPPICLAVSVAFALREAIAASREDSGIPRSQCVMNY